MSKINAQFGHNCTTAFERAVEETMKGSWDLKEVPIPSKEDERLYWLAIYHSLQPARSPGDFNLETRSEYSLSSRAMVLTKSFFLYLISTVPSGSRTPPRLFRSIPRKKNADR